MNANKLTFLSSCYTITGGVLTLSGTALAGTAGLIKVGTGMLTLKGSAVNSYTGTTSVNGGTLALDFANLAPPTNLLNSSPPLSMGGGTLSILGKSGATATSQTFTSLTMGAGASKISITPGTSAAGLTITTFNTPSNNQGGCLVS